MNADGPIVNLLVLRVDGSTEELVVDMTPRDRKLDILLGAKGLTFLGQYDDLGVVVITGKDPAAPLSTHILPFPLHEEKLRGDIVLMKSDDDGIPGDFTAAEFKALADRPVSAEDRGSYEEEKRNRAELELRRQRQNLSSVAEEDEDEDDEEDDEYTAEDAEADDVETDEDEEEEEEDDEDDEEAANDPKVQLLNSVVLRFSAEFGREPTMDEIKVG
jgi:hypothetical protein